jgi:hypothetical protein
MVTFDLESRSDLGLDSLAHATAWFAPLPPHAVSRWLVIIVSPGKGKCETCETRSTFRDPKTAITGFGDAMLMIRVVRTWNGRLSL